MTIKQHIIDKCCLIAESYESVDREEKMERTDRRVRKTKAQLNAGLAKLMRTKNINEITVKELVDEVDINRSTFYLHYTDIHNLLDSIEQDLLKRIQQVIEAHPVLPHNKNTFPFIADMFTILEKNKEICGALLGQHGDMHFIRQIEQIIAENSIKSISHLYPAGKNDLRYYYDFCLSGCLGLLKSWMEQDNPESPEHMAELTYKMVTHAMDVFYESVE